VSVPTPILGAGQYLTDIHSAGMYMIKPTLVIGQKHTTTLISAMDTLGQETSLKHLTSAFKKPIVIIS
jgi:hypothetical protein